MDTNSFENASFNDIVFYNRNKAFGAYQLRNDYDRHVTLALFVTYSFIVLLFAVRFFVTRFSPTQPADLGKQIVCTFNTIVPPKPIAVPEVSSKSASARSERFTEMHVTQSPLETEAPPTQNALRESNVGNTTSNSPTNSGYGTTTDGCEVDKPTPPEPATVNNSIFDMPEVFPEYIGGEKALYSFLTKNILYPNRARDLEVEGKVILRFVIGTDGNVENVEVLRGVGFGCDEEAIRVVKLLKFKPGYQGNRAVKTRMVVPIKFSLQ